MPFQADTSAEAKAFTRDGSGKASKCTSEKAERCPRCPSRSSRILLAPGLSALLVFCQYWYRFQGKLSDNRNIGNGCEQSRLSQGAMAALRTNLCGVWGNERMAR